MGFRVTQQVQAGLADPTAYALDHELYALGASEPSVRSFTRLAEIPSADRAGLCSGRRDGTEHVHHLQTWENQNHSQP